MRVAARYIHRQILLAVLFVTLSFLALFLFFDVINEVNFSSSNAAVRYTVLNSMVYVALLVPEHVYELLPIAVLIGAIFVMANMAMTSEFTILRTSGMGPWRALRILLVLGALFTVGTFLVGDYVAPKTNKLAQLYKARFEGRITAGRTGAWMKENQVDHDRIINVHELTPDGEMRQIRVFDFNAQGLLADTIEAGSGRFSDKGWTLHDVQRNQLVGADGNTGHARMQRTHLDSLSLDTSIHQGMVAAALIDPDRMSTFELYRYISHLKENNQSARNYEIQFWRKVFYPLSCLVMVILALPFAYLHFRSGNISTAVFGGVVVGISFFLLNNVFGYIGNMHAWMPWLAAAIPSLIYTAISLTAFTWLVLKR